MKEKRRTIMEILYISACVRQNSRTRYLAAHLLKKLDGNITAAELDKENILPLNSETLALRDNIIRRGEYNADMLRYARDFAAADIIVIAAPYWDLGFPALLKAYLEQITALNVTFRYNESGVPEGLCRAKKLYYVTTAGGTIFADFGYSYIKTIAEVFFGIKDTVCFKAEGLDIYGADTDEILRAAQDNMDKYFTEM